MVRDVPSLLGVCDLPIFWSSPNPSNRNPTAVMHECEKSAIASYELEMSEFVSSFAWVGRASAICFRILSVLSGSFAMVRSVR